MTYAEKIDVRRAPARSLAQRRRAGRTVRALTPHIGAWVELDGDERLGVRAARALSEPGPARASSPRRDGRLLLGTADGALELLEVQPPGERPCPRPTTCAAGIPRLQSSA